MARTFIGELTEKLQWIAASGSLGVARDELSPGLRLSLLKDRNIYFRIVNDECRIIRVLHARQDIRPERFDE